MLKSIRVFYAVILEEKKKEENVEKTGKTCSDFYQILIFVYFARPNFKLIANQCIRLLYIIRQPFAVENPLHKIFSDLLLQNPYK